MDKQALLSGFALSVKDACAARDWDALAHANRRMSECLPLLSAQGGLHGAERAALEQLIAAHRHSVELCARELGYLDGKLDEICANKDGWLAYAANAATHELEP
jgi:hypothetical protein